jgi:hypothetical protein
LPIPRRLEQVSVASNEGRLHQIGRADQQFLRLRTYREGWGIFVPVPGSNLIWLSLQRLPPRHHLNRRINQDFWLICLGTPLSGCAGLTSFVARLMRLPEVELGAGLS